MRMELKELFEICTGVELPWHITKDMIFRRDKEGEFELSFSGYKDVVLSLEDLEVYIDTPVFKKLLASYSLSFVYGVLPQHRQLFIEWVSPEDIRAKEEQLKFKERQNKNKD